MLESATKTGMFFFEYGPEFLYLWLPSVVYFFLPRLQQKSLALSAYIQATLLGGVALTIMAIFVSEGLALVIFPIIYLCSLLPLAFVGAIYGFPLVLLLKELKFGARALCIAFGIIPGFLISIVHINSSGIATMAMLVGALVMFAAMTGIRYKQEQQRLAQTEQSP